MMNAIVLYHPGEAENLRLEERPVPMAGEGQVVVKVKAFGLNRSELMTRKGLSPDVAFPRVLGIECAGEVESDPSGEYMKGQKVLALMGGMGRDYDGSYAAFTVLPKSVLHPVQSTLPWEKLGAIPEMFQTAYGSLHLALKIQAGEAMLIRGATSSVGMLALQLAKNAGLTVIATTRSKEKKRQLLENGAALVVIDDGRICDQVRTLFPEGVDKVLELVGTSTLKDSLECIKPGGTGCMTGMLSEQWSVPDFAPMEFIPATVRLTIYDSGQVRSTTDIFQQFIQQVETGCVKLNVTHVFALQEIVKAHRLMERNMANGKIVVVT